MREFRTGSTADYLLCLGIVLLQHKHLAGLGIITGGLHFWHVQWDPFSCSCLNSFRLVSQHFTW